MTKKGHLILDLDAEVTRCGVCGSILEGCIRKDESADDCDDFTIFGNRLAKLLKERNMTQKDLAGMIGCTEATMSRYVNNERTPKANVIVQMAKALRISADELLGM